ncbi:MAG: hypothetical protein E6G44_07800 [Actinobacteria bacterium]|nr:MAG: hypothetical protein E6G44_07800 [Actinomycetota bacterium]
MHASEEELKGWFAGRIPQGWFTGPPDIAIDREEILIIGTLPDVELGKDAGSDALRAARAGRIKQHREDTREARMAIAREAEHRFRHKVAWGATCGDVTELFTTLSIPVMTRLRMREREVLDTLVESGVARSRSHALAWCVRLVAENQGEWISKLREALSSVQQVRSEGPGFGSV